MGFSQESDGYIPLTSTPTTCSLSPTSAPSWKNFSSLGMQKFWAKLLATCSHSMPMEFRPLETSLEDLGALSAFSLNTFSPWGNEHGFGSGSCWFWGCHLLNNFIRPVGHGFWPGPPSGITWYVLWSQYVSFTIQMGFLQLPTNEFPSLHRLQVPSLNLQRIDL